MEFNFWNKVSKEIQAENEQFSARIAKLTGLTPDEINLKEVKSVYSANLINLGICSYEKKYIGLNGSLRGQSERGQQFCQLAEAMLDLPPFYFSYGLFAPSYISGLHLQKQNLSNRDKVHKSLLAGALTEDTVREYAASVRFVQPDALCYTVDIEGEATSKIEPKTSSFVYGDALRLPFANGVFDSMHTNILLPDLVKKCPPFIRPKIRKQFFSEAARALSDNGCLFLVERHNDIHDEELREAGFLNILRTQAFKFSSRRDMEKMLRFGEIDKRYKIGYFDDIDFIIAAKQAICISAAQSSASNISK